MWSLVIRILVFNSLTKGQIVDYQDDEHEGELDIIWLIILACSCLCAGAWLFGLSCLLYQKKKQLSQLISNYKSDDDDNDDYDVDDDYVLAYEPPKKKSMAEIKYQAPPKKKSLAEIKYLAPPEKKKEHEVEEIPREKIEVPHPALEPYRPIKIEPEKKIEDVKIIEEPKKEEVVVKKVEKKKERPKKLPPKKGEKKGDKKGDKKVDKKKDGKKNDDKKEDKKKDDKKKDKDKGIIEENMKDIKKDETIKPEAKSEKYKDRELQIFASESISDVGPGEQITRRLDSYIRIHKEGKRKYY